MTEPERQPPDRYDGQVLDAELHILDRQILDRDDLPVVVADDIEISDIPFGDPIEPGTPPPVITNLLSGSAFWTRVFGGRPPSSRLHRIPWSAVQEVGIAISLGVPGESLDLTWPERWARDHIVARIPGGRHDPE